MTELPNVYHGQFLQIDPEPWRVLTSGRLAGEVRSAGDDDYTAGNVTFVQIYEAG